jgi:hypothetical protein
MVVAHKDRLPRFWGGSGISLSEARNVGEVILNEGEVANNRRANVATALGSVDDASQERESVGFASLGESSLGSL